ncbi:MAG: PHB depolymerase family esterase, partial [Myxococcales bacterium]|nr:PHB depolymerase family esterase [Myxococcales bacterium]
MHRIQLALVSILAVAVVAVAAPRPAAAALTAVTSFGSNPGALDMYIYVPAGLPADRPVVVVLHGCTQGAADMEATGWNDLADELGFAVVYPQQRTANNPVRCFNWAGEYGDTANLTRGQGENQSIVSMVDHMIATYDSDPARVYVTGFSAGAAMTAVLLATWPDRFAAGSIMSGIPYRCATDVNTAYSCQQLQLHPELGKTPAAWGDLVRAADPAWTGPWPRVQIWHGTSDGTVADENQQELIEQWTNVAGTDADADVTDTAGDVTRRGFEKNGTVVVEAYTVTGMAHAVCVGRGDPTYPCGPQAASYYEDHGTCSTYQAARFFGLTGGGGGGGGGGDDTTAPTVDVLSPSDGATVSGTLAVVVAASDDVGVDHVELTVDGVSLGVDDTAPYQFAWTTTSVADGAHALVATAWDAAGNPATDDDTTVTVVNADGGGGGGGGGGGDGGVGGDDDDGAGSGGPAP